MYMRKLTLKESRTYLRDYQLLLYENMQEKWKATLEYSGLDVYAVQ